MKKLSMLLVAGVFVCGLAHAQKPAMVPAAPVAAPVIAAPAEMKKEEPKPEVLWMNETSHDFGKIPQGKPVTTEFTLKNTGTDSLKLDMVQAGCGCTTPVWKPGPYAAGETFKITVGYNAAGVGQFNKPVTITYKGQQKVIYITGEVFTTPAAPAPANANVQKVQ